jgi:hypothetical protein
VDSAPKADSPGGNPDPGGIPVRRTASRPRRRLPQLRRSLASRRTPLAVPHPPRPVSGPDVSDLPVRRPWWLLAARHAMTRLGRLHTPEPAPSAATPAPAERLSSVVPAPVHRPPLVRSAARVARPPAADLVASLRTRTRPVTRTPAATVVAAHRDLPMVRRARLLSETLPAPADGR